MSSRSTLRVRACTHAVCARGHGFGKPRGAARLGQASSAAWPAQQQSVWCGVVWCAAPRCAGRLYFLRRHCPLNPLALRVSFALLHPGANERSPGSLSPPREHACMPVGGGWGRRRARMSRCRQRVLRGLRFVSARGFGLRR